jgi:predicted DNA binding CopG/RHH family protein
MTKDDTHNNRKSFTLRLNAELSQKVEREADSLGLTQNSYITMILHKTLRKEMERG